MTVLGTTAADVPTPILVTADGTVLTSGTTTLGGGSASIGSVTITDGGNDVDVTAAEELRVLASAQPGTDIGDVTVNNAAGAAAVNVQDGGNSLTVDNAALAVIGGGVEATALRVTLASDGTGVLSVDDNAGSLTVDSAQLPAALVGGRLDVVVGAALPAGASNIGDVDVLTLPALPAGTATIGSVSITDGADSVLVTSARELQVIPSREAHVDNLGARLAISSAIVVSATLTAGGTTQLVAAQGAGNSIVVLGWIISADAVTNVRFLAGATQDPDAAISQAAFLAANGGWTSDYESQWYETSDNAALVLWSSAAATVGVTVRYGVR